MARFGRMVKGWALYACAATVSIAGAQFAPPTSLVQPPGDATTHPAAAFPAAPTGLLITPPTGPTASVSITPPLPNGTSRDIFKSDALASLRPDEPLLINALIGNVNSTPVFLMDVFRPIDEKLRRLGQTAHSLPEFKNSAAGLIQEQLGRLKYELLFSSAAANTLSEQEKQGLTIYLAKERLDLISSSGGSEAMAERALAARNSTIDKELSDRKRFFIAQIYYHKNIMPQIVVTRQMILAAYEKNPKRWQEDPQVELYTLTLPLVRWLREPSTNGERGPIIEKPTAAQVTAAEGQAAAFARDLASQLKKGADFASLVENNDSRDPAANVGGRNAGVKRGSMANAKLENYVFSLPANTVGEPQLLRDPDPKRTSIVIVKVGDKKEARTIPFSEAQGTIRNELYQAQLERLTTEYEQKLESSGTVERVDVMIGAAVDAAVARYATR